MAYVSWPLANDGLMVDLRDAVVVVTTESAD
jgi:hypothetical protein